MNFNPKYKITHKLLENIKKIDQLIIELNGKKFSRNVLAKLEREARTLSSFSSTSIEGNPLPLTDVKRLLKSKPKNIRDTEREVLNYNKALETLDKKLKAGGVKITKRLILDVHKKAVNGLVPKHMIGKFRQGSVFVNDPRSRQVVYLPPDFKDVLPMIKCLLKFVNEGRGKVEPLVLAGIFHRQFVIIHPFTDGNGRAARLCTKVLMADMGLDTFRLFSFENFYNLNVTKYFEKVGVYGDYSEVAKKIDFTEWLEYFTDGIIDELNRVKKSLISELGPEQALKVYHKKILSYIKKHGYIKDRDYAALTTRAKATRSLDFQKLIKLGLIERKGKGPATYYVLSS